ncbi:hypothetical protein [Aestuariivirga sp.]|uniref:hypothetical protein n=1 Tax=Aestuariivirga sp. TaxID=2650926 RepID=UPI0039E4C2B5
MTQLGLLKAARAAGVSWAVSEDKACTAAGIRALLYPIPISKQKPLMTMNIYTLNIVQERHGEKALRAGLYSLAKAQGSGIPGFINSRAIKNC